MRLQIKLNLLLSMLLAGHITVCAADRGDSSKIKQLHRLITLPVILHSPETKWGGGVAMSLTFKIKKTDSLSRTSNIQVLGLYTQRHQKLIGIESSLFFNKENFILRFHGTYSFYPDKFWGLGNKTNSKTYELFSYEQFFIFPQLLRRIYKKLYVGASFEYQNITKFNYQPIGLFIDPEIAGRRGGIVSGAGGLLTWDNRDNAFSSSRGQFVELSTTVFADGTESEFNYTNYVIDARKYFSIPSGDVIAFQVYGNFNKGTVPFLSLAAMGGGTIMRGYYSGRFRDKNFMAAQAEYRMHVWKKWGIVAFAGIGQVGNRVEKFALNQFKYAVGSGIRFALLPEERLNLRLDYGVAANSSGFYLTISEAF